MARFNGVFILSIVLFAGCEPTASQVAQLADADSQALRGDWVAVSREFKGTWADYEADHATYKFSFYGTRVAETTSSTTKNAKVVLDPAKRQKEITFTYPPHFGSWGTYELNGDKLIITWAVGKNIEPNESEYAKFVLEPVAN